jgi:hypothetical protein
MMFKSSGYEGGSFWTSGVRLYGSDNFIWSSTGELISKYKNWKSSQPNDLQSTNVCIYFLTGHVGSWIDTNCDTDTNKVICEQK